MQEKLYLVFTRHELTEEQIEEFREVMSQFEEGTCEIRYLTELASRNITDLQDADDIHMELFGLLRKEKNNFNFIELYGVIPVPLRFVIQEFNRDMPTRSKNYCNINESFNVSRSIEGQKSTIDHKRWLPVGDIRY